FPGVDFIYTDLLAPDKGAFNAIRADVLSPWSGPHSTTLHGSFGSSGTSTRSFKLPTPLDGTASFALSAPAGASYRLRVLAGARTPDGAWCRGRTRLARARGPRRASAPRSSRHLRDRVRQDAAGQLEVLRLGPLGRMVAEPIAARHEQHRRGHAARHVARIVA